MFVVFLHGSMDLHLMQIETKYFSHLPGILTLLDWVETVTVATNQVRGLTLPTVYIVSML